jgi:hypothetical protein
MTAAGIAIDDRDSNVKVTSRVTSDNLHIKCV